MSYLPRIVSVTADSARQLLLEFDDGRRVLLDLGEYIARGGVFSELADPQFALAFRITENGRVLSWPGELDFCADALYDRQARHLNPLGSPDSLTRS
ncbi:MAG: DUF2442 domain-containing protein [bacterium]